MLANSFPIERVIASDLAAVCKQIEQSQGDASHTLVAFDVDLTLTVVKHPAFYWPNLKKHQFIWKQIFEALPSIQKDQVLSGVIHYHEQTLIEADAPNVIQSLQADGFKVIGLTALLTGALFDAVTLQDRRSQSLQALGIDFSPASVDPCIELVDIPSYNGQYPIYDQGILYSNGELRQHNKGTVLVSWLEKVNFKPKQVMMIDDKHRNLTDIGEALAAYDPTIKFVGIEYVGGQAYAPDAIEEAAFLKFWQTHIDQIQQKLKPARNQQVIS